MGTIQNGTVAPARVRETIEQAEREYHVLGAMSFGDIPEGHSVVLNVIKANPDSKAGDVYDVGMGKYGLTGNFLHALADAAGVSVADSKMLAYEVNYCHAEVTVARMGLDGRVRRMTARKVMDLRPGSGMLKAMEEGAKAKNKDAKAQIREQRLRITEHADSKARLRAFRAILSVRTYTPEELKKPFAVFTLQFTGRTNDPQLKQIFAVGLMNASLGAMGALFGPQPVMQGPAFMMGGGAPAGLLGGGGSTGALPPDPSDGVPDEDELPAGGGASSAPVTVRAGDPTRIKIPGKSGKMVAEAEEKDLVYWEKRGRGDLLAGKWAGDRYEESNIRQLLTIRAEMRHRKMPVEPCPDLDGPPAREPEPAARPQQRPPSDRGAASDPRAKTSVEAPFGSDDDSQEPEDDGSVPPDREPR